MMSRSMFPIALCVFGVAALLGGVSPTRAVAQRAGAVAPATWQGDIHGVATWITVIPRGHDIPDSVRKSPAWWQWGNTTTDAYVFAFHRPDDVRLILDFNTQADGSVVARFYANQRGTAKLAYTQSGEKLDILTDGGHPYVTVQTLHGGWLSGGKTNYTLQVAVDDSGVQKDSAALADGVVDEIIKVGSAGDGTPAWETIRILPQPGRPQLHYSAQQFMPQAPPFRKAAPLMPGFPYFDIGPTVLPADWLIENPNPLYFDLAYMRLQVLRFLGAETGGLYWINSTAMPPQVDFESPFAFYNFDPTRRDAQLVIRALYYPASDPIVAPWKSIDLPHSTFRYSWRGQIDGLWSYSLQTAGIYSYTQTTQLGGDLVNAIPSAELPGWVISQPWPIVMFVEAVGGFPSQEGIYAYSPQSFDHWPWIEGATVQEPLYFSQPYIPVRAPTQDDTVYTSLPGNFRGEYNAAYLRQPKLYFSPVDDRMHLLYAEGGLWNLGDGQVLRMRNLDQGPYINGWTREQVPAQNVPAGRIQALPGQTLEALYMLNGYMIYSGTLGSELRQVRVVPESFETLPPTDKVSWQAFQQLLAPYSTLTRDPHNLHQWLDVAGGDTLLSTTGSISGLRATKDGFRFIVDLQSASKVNGSVIANGDRWTPGRYAVGYNGMFVLELLRPAEITGTVAVVASGPSGQESLQIALRNVGLMDVVSTTLALQATAPSGRTSTVATNLVSLLAGVPVTTTLQWTPAVAGDWTLTPQITQAGGAPQIFPATHVNVAAVPPATAALLTASVAPSGFGFLVLSLLALALLGALIIWRQSQVASEEAR